MVPGRPPPLGRHDLVHDPDELRGDVEGHRARHTGEHPGRAFGAGAGQGVGVAEIDQCVGPFTEEFVVVEEVAFDWDEGARVPPVSLR
ncbi:hypothetical protein [Nocardiopsis sp. ATB16-24]|uniref:hypothetical protein n=1 Tax=Nocardiopsis sp. ATB16-24 TaxID=3019555 RepID=UPI002553CF2E|nr:hypothetical protein [Nocardiopsis sp. ATB16-24]